MRQVEQWVCLLLWILLANTLNFQIYPGLRCDTADLT